MKKKHQNGKRSRTPDPTAESEEKKGPKETEESEKTEEPEASVEHGDSDSEAAEDLEFDEEMVEQVRMQTSFIEGREVSCEEILEMLKRVMRQHSMASERRLDYVVRFLKEEEEKPP